MIVREIAATLSHRKVTEIILEGAFKGALPERLLATGGVQTVNEFWAYTLLTHNKRCSREQREDHLTQNL